MALVVVSSMTVTSHQEDMAEAAEAVMAIMEEIVDGFVCQEV